jgi:GNAT superfamily N-acetyltransferase
MKVQGVSWRAMTGYDLEQVNRIAAAVHPSFYEEPAVLAERHELYRHGSYLFEIGERPTGYVLSHPWLFGHPPALNTLLHELPPAADTFYIHDLALLPVARRVGAASFIVEALVKHAAAEGYPTVSLVAVNGSQPFWSRLGFEVVSRPELDAHLQTYEPAAALMMRRL